MLPQRFRLTHPAKSPPLELIVDVERHQTRGRTRRDGGVDPPNALVEPLEQRPRVRFVLHPLKLEQRLLLDEALE